MIETRKQPIDCCNFWWIIEYKRRRKKRKEKKREAKKLIWYYFRCCFQSKDWKIWSSSSISIQKRLLENTMHTKDHVKSTSVEKSGNWVILLVWIIFKLKKKMRNFCALEENIRNWFKIISSISILKTFTLEINSRNRMWAITYL
jgi:hypothetical protein